MSAAVGIDEMTRMVYGSMAVIYAHLRLNSIVCVPFIAENACIRPNMAAYNRTQRGSIS